MRNISFSLTTPQFKARSKFVTRRLGWDYLEINEELMGCEKCMGRKPGEELVRLGPIIVAEKRREPLEFMTKDPAYGFAETVLEGFPEMTPEQFVEFFCRTHKVKLETGKIMQCTPATVITRIAFRYL